MHLVLGRFNRSHSFIAPASENEGAKRPPFADQMNIETDFYKTNASRLRSTEFLIWDFCNYALISIGDSPTSRILKTPWEF